jgi:uncharacterized protein YlzI (FlbEa/FlbD family)
MSSIIHMVNGKEFLVLETNKEVMDALGYSGHGNGRSRPMRPLQGPTFVRFTKFDGLPLYLNTEAIAIITEQE